MDYCEGWKTRSVFGSFSLAMFQEHILYFLLFLSLSTSIFLLWFCGTKKFEVIFLLCLIMIVQPPQMLVKSSNRWEKFYYFWMVFFLPYASSKVSLYLQITILRWFLWTDVVFFSSGPLLSSLCSKWNLLATVKSCFNILWHCVLPSSYKTHTYNGIYCWW